MKPAFPLFGTKYAFVVDKEGYTLHNYKTYPDYVWKDGDNVTFISFVLADIIGRAEMYINNAHRNKMIAGGFWILRD